MTEYKCNPMGTFIKGLVPSERLRVPYLIRFPRGLEVVGPPLSSTLGPERAQLCLGPHSKLEEQQGREAGPKVF